MTAPGSLPLHDADEVLLGFTRALQEAGVPVTPDRAQRYLAAVAELGPTAEGTRGAGRATLCASPDDLARHDRVFAVYYTQHWELPRPGPAAPAPDTSSDLPMTDADGDPGGLGDEDSVAIRAMATDTDVLRHRDVAALSLAERARINALFATLRPQSPQRRSARPRAWHRGKVDAARTVRASMRRMGEPAKVLYERRVTKPRRVVLLIDVSGSMSGYAEALLRLAYRLTQSAPGAVETFTIGTRLTHLTRSLRLRDPEQALIAASATVADWSGGTRLGENLQAFLTRWGRRGMARGAVVVVFSDGWERGDTTLLAEQAEALARLSHRLIWVNPHQGKVGYEPLQQGVKAVLPHVDDFIAGHSLATYDEVLDVIARA